MTLGFERNFENAVDRAYAIDASKLIENSSRRHARYLIGRLLEKAAEKSLPTRIFTGSLNTKTYGDATVIDGLKLCLEKSLSVEVISEDPIDQSPVHNPFLAITHNNNRASFLGRVDSTKIASMGHHFIVVGMQAFRIERDHGTSSALGCFNRPDMAAKLVDDFQEYNLRLT